MKIIQNFHMTFLLQLTNNSFSKMAIRDNLDMPDDVVYKSCG